MASPFQETLAISIARVLKPLVRLALLSGFGWTEFLNVAKSVFVEVATEDYGLRGRPTNISRIAAMTGISRKEISKIRSRFKVARWTPNMEKSPANTVVHHWHHDPEFCVQPGVPRVLHFSGKESFAELVKKYAGDIPPGAMRKELCRSGTVTELTDGRLQAERRFLYPNVQYDDFLRNIAFAWANLGNTVVHNVSILTSERELEAKTLTQGRFERSAWSELLRPDAAIEFRQWVRTEGALFLERADHWIGQHETSIEDRSDTERSTIGVGVYFFEEA